MLHSLNIYKPLATYTRSFNSYLLCISDPECDVIECNVTTRSFRLQLDKQFTNTKLIRKLTLN